MCQEDLKPAQKKPYRKHERSQRKRRRRPQLASASTTDASLIASDLDQNSSVSFEPANFDHDDDDNDNHQERTNDHPVKSEQSHSEMDILEEIHFLNQSIENLSNHVQSGDLSTTAITMITDAAKRLKQLEQKINGGKGEDRDNDGWMNATEAESDERNMQYDITVNLGQTDANRLMQSGHIFFNGGKLCFSTRKKGAGDNS